jgi:aminomethyltransferase
MTTPTASLKRTPLYSLHRERGARLAPFAGWEMPLEYSGVVDEHLAVRLAAGLFDVSHMGQIAVEGPGALALLQALTPNDVSRLRVGQAHYSALTTDSGGFVDDLVVYRVEDSRYLLVVNASNVERDFAWIRDHGTGAVTLENRSDDYSLLALQGPLAVEMLASLTADPIEQLGYYRFADAVVAGEPTMISRNGYTGEDGFELMVAPKAAERLWRLLLEKGSPRGLKPVGLAARDTLRLEAKMVLYGNDIDEDHTVLEADLGWMVKWDKGEFMGREALARQKERGVARKLVGFELSDRGVARHGHQAWVAGRPVGPVTSGTHTPYLKKSIGLVYLPAEATSVGSEFEIDLRGRRAKASVVRTPFYKRGPSASASGKGG